MKSYYKQYNAKERCKSVIEILKKEEYYPLINCYNTKKGYKVVPDGNHYRVSK